MANFPTLDAGAISRTPFVEARVFRTGVHQHFDGSEQRWARRPTAYGEFTLNLRALSAADRDAVRTFFLSTKGGYDSTWTLDHASVGTWNYCVFVDDECVATENKAGRYDVSLRVRQVRRN